MIMEIVIIILIIIINTITMTIIMIILIISLRKNRMRNETVLLSEHGPRYVLTVCFLVQIETKKRAERFFVFQFFPKTKKRKFSSFFRFSVLTKRQTLGKSRDANTEVPQTAVHILADRR